MAEGKKSICPCKDRLMMVMVTTMMMRMMLVLGLLFHRTNIRSIKCSKILSANGSSFAKKANTDISLGLTCVKMQFKTRETTPAVHVNQEFFWCARPPFCSGLRVSGLGEKKPCKKPKRKKKNPQPHPPSTQQSFLLLVALRSQTKKQNNPKNNSSGAQEGGRGGEKEREGEDDCRGYYCGCSLLFLFGGEGGGG